MRIRAAWQADEIALPKSAVHTVVSLRARPIDDYTPDLNAKDAFLLGDGLISIVGQAVLPEDMCIDSNSVRPPETYNLPACLDAKFTDGMLKGLDRSPAKGTADSSTHVSLEGRPYYFASRAAHSPFQLKNWDPFVPVFPDRLTFVGPETVQYPIAEYADEVVVGEDWLGRDFKASHPLRYFIDNVLKRTNPTPAEVIDVSARVSGSARVQPGNTPASGATAWRSFIAAQDDGVVVARQPFNLDLYGQYAFDAATTLRANFGNDVVLANYRVRVEMGNGIDFYQTSSTTPALSNESASYDLGVVKLVPVAPGTPLVNASGTVRSSQSPFPAIGGAEVWLARGVNLSAAEVRAIPSSNVARYVAADAIGAFAITGLRVGEYTVVVARGGFAELLRGAVTIDGTTALAFSLNPVGPWSDSGKLNDTGITANQCYAAGSSNFVPCNSPAAIALNDQQDGMVGRDVVNNDNSDGKAGFSFSLVPKPSGGYYDKTECVRDNVTGQIWEGKTANGGLRDATRTYTNWGDGRPGDSSAYVGQVNASALCGYTDWRLPKVHELQAIVDYGVPSPGPSIDMAWFPNTQQYAYWSSSPIVGPFGGLAYLVEFEFGNVGYNWADSNFNVRLVR